MLTDEMLTQFDHKEAEKRLSALWEKLKVSQGKVDPSKKPFCVVIPPPNVTGILHMGHVLDNVPQDIMTRWHRMRGYAAVWIPGTDHAGIATQNVVKKNLEKEGINFRDLGREDFVKHVWEFKEKSGSTIIEQLKRLGCSCDWDRERFTMDAQSIKAVLTAFVMLYEKNLIYRGKRMINWCTVCQTALSDDEIEHENQSGHLWHIRYPLLDDQGQRLDEVLVVATTRPETMLGDAGIAVHPEDIRYKNILGKKVLLPIQNRAIPIIADEFVDPKFGTGAVKLTPAHDPNDYQAGIKHGLSLIEVIGDDGKMTAAAGTEYVGLDRYKARKKLVADLEAIGAIEKVEKYSNAVGQCYRCQSVLEPKVSDQWFVKMKPLAEKAKQAVLEDQISIIPDSERHDYFHWMDNIQDWCISRQLWWGHRIPVYYCDSCNHISANVEAPASCMKCGSKSLRQDEDVLDTWFSSQLWPFSTLGWPDQTEELKFWYPNSWLMSGRDILFFWDARMIIVGLELLGKVPFQTLALHGLVRDSQGRKLSKSLGNSPDPLVLFDQYGTDAVRVAITSNYPMGRQDTRLNEEIFKSGQAVVIKLWNATRLILCSLSGEKVNLDLRSVNLSALEDRWILSRLSEVIEAHDNYLHKSDFIHAINSVKSFFWDNYCDWYLELIKPRLRAGGTDKENVLQVALICQRVILKLLHPYMPFVTEELWQIMLQQGISEQGEDQMSIALASWPNPDLFPRDSGADLQIGMLTSIIRGVRDVRQSLFISSKTELEAKLSFMTEVGRNNFKAIRGMAQMVGAISDFSEYSEKSTRVGYVPFKFDGGIGYLNLPKDIDAKDIADKLTARIDKLKKVILGIESKLANEDFIKNAPQILVNESRSQALELQESIAKLDDFRKSLG